MPNILFIEINLPPQEVQAKLFTIFLPLIYQIVFQPNWIYPA